MEIQRLARLPRWRGDKDQSRRDVHALAEDLILGAVGGRGNATRQTLDELHGFGHQVLAGRIELVKGVSLEPVNQSSEALLLEAPHVVSGHVLEQSV